jgi:acetyl-CoA carboxylase biotin carboxylase subunit
VIGRTERDRPAERRIHKVLVANRGEIAVRVFQTCRELGIGTVAVHSEADVASPHRFAADESVLLGPAPATESYLRADRVIEAARRSGADAIHPGYGFLSENASFASEVEEAGITFLGPTGEQIAAMGDKVEARRRMEAAGVPVIPGTEGPVGPEDLRAEAERIGFPLLLKAAGGGGGKGIRKVDSIGEVEAAYERTTREAGAAFGDSRVYLERFVHPSRHVEVQVLGDGRGNGLFLGERECSLQRNHQKLVEETPSPAISDAVRARMREASLAGVAALSYRGAGTFEYLYDEAREEFYFLEMNTRLQVEHPVTEQVTGLDLVAEQLAIGEGRSLEGVPEPTRRGASVEFRIYAEDPYRGFRPSTGTIRALRLPHTPFGRIDANLRDGQEITPWYDPMLAKAIAWGPTRLQAIDRLIALLSRIRIGGIHTTVPLGIEICRSEFFRAGDFHTGTLEEWLDRPELPRERPELLERLAAIIARDQIGARRPVGEEAPADGGSWGRVGRLEGTGRRARP